MSGHEYEVTPERIAVIHAIRDQIKGYTGAAQRLRMMAILRALRSVSTFEFSRYGDIYDPRPRKLELVREGNTIMTTRRAMRTESGERHSLGVYTLLAEAVE